MSREAFEKWAADKTFLIKAGDDYVNVKQMAREVWQAALESQTAQPQVPEGYVLVPANPTTAMKNAATSIQIYLDHECELDAMTWEEVEKIYKAMITASQEENKIDRD